MKLRFSVLFVAIICLGLIGCETQELGDPIVGFESDDSEMVRAVSTARNTLEKFESKWKSMKYDDVGIKIAVPTVDDGVEHIWFTPVEISATEVTGICANSPVNVQGLQAGDTRTYPKSDVSDWVILVGEKCYGGYTMRVMSKRQPKMAPPYEYVDF